MSFWQKIKDTFTQRIAPIINRIKTRFTPKPKPIKPPAKTPVKPPIKHGYSPPTKVIKPIAPGSVIEPETPLIEIPAETRVTFVGHVLALESSKRAERYRDFYWDTKRVITGETDYQVYKALEESAASDYFNRYGDEFAFTGTFTWAGGSVSEN